MLKKLLFATTITIVLHLFLGVNSSSQSNFQQPSKEKIAQPTLATALEIHSEQPIVANTEKRAILD